MKKIMIISQTVHFSRIHQGLLDDLRESRIPYEKHQSHTVITEDVAYFFVNLNRRNLKRFAKKHGKMDRIYSNDLGLLKQLYHANIHSGLERGKSLPWQRKLVDEESHYWKRLRPEHVTIMLELVDYTSPNILHLQDTHALLLKELGEEVEVRERNKRPVYAEQENSADFWANPDRRLRLRDTYYMDVFVLTNNRQIEQQTILKNKFRSSVHYRSEAELVQVLKEKTEKNINRLVKELDQDREMLTFLQEQDMD